MKARLLAAAFLLPSLGAALFEGSSPVASALRQGAPIQAFISAPGPSGERLYWALYKPASGILDLVYLQGIKPRRRELYAQGALSLPELAAPWTAAPETDPALALKEALVRALKSDGFWLRLPAVLKTGGRSRFDALALALELRRARPDDIRPAWLPEEPARAAFLEKLLSAAPGPAPRAQATVEVLNASGQKGVALEATKFLRSKGLDVVYFGNTAVQPRSVVYDRTGDIATARMIQSYLGCPQAAIVTHIQPDKLLDATVSLAADCAKEAPGETNGTR